MRPIRPADLTRAPQGPRATERLKRSRASTSQPPVHVPWGVALRAPVQGVMRHGGAIGRPKGGTMTTYRLYVGIDWATQAHRVVVVDGERRVLVERAVRHGAIELESLATELSELAGGVPSNVAVGLETPRGAVVDTLLARGVQVFAINPKQL